MPIPPATECLDTLSSLAQEPLIAQGSWYVNRKRSGLSTFLRTNRGIHGGEFSGKLAKIREKNGFFATSRLCRRMLSCLTGTLAAGIAIAW